MTDYLVLELQNGRLQARLEMGSGEVVLESIQGLQLNNLVDHKVTVTLQGASLAMMIDELYSSIVTLANIQEELSIDLGFYLGGTGDEEMTYLEGSTPPFRGCMSNVQFEVDNLDMLESEQPACHETKEDCSSEFQAADGDTISLISPKSFISLPTWSFLESRTVQLLMKTTTEDALLFFHLGQQSDFIAVGIMDSYLKGVVNMGNGVIILDNTLVELDDDQWHRVEVRIDPSIFEITVDSQATTVPLSGSESLDLKGNLFLGGLEKKVNDELRNTGILSIIDKKISTESFIGCLGEIRINEKERSLQDALVTRDVHLNCEGDIYDYSSYLYTTASPVEFHTVNFNSIEQHCFPTVDMPEAFQNLTKLLDIKPLIVPEGSEAFLDINNISPTLDLSKAGIRQSQIVFTLQDKWPLYGQMDFNVNNKKTKKFTLLDVVNRKIKYIHHGTERYSDQIVFDVVAHSYSYLPECLKTPQNYILPVQITPVNDIPQLNGGDILISEYARTRLSADIIKVVDADTRCDKLMLTVTSGPSMDEGYLENAGQPGEKIEEFSCKELKDGNIYYVHQSGVMGELRLQVSDGHSLSQPAIFKLLAHEPEMTLVTNTGLILYQGEFSEIGTNNLAVSATPQNGDIVYLMTEALYFGELQMLTHDGEWKKVNSFQQSDLQQGQLRYVNTDTQNHEEMIVERVQFDVQLGRLILRNNTFLIKIKPSEVMMAKMVPLKIENGGQKAIKQTELEAVVKGKNVVSSSLKYMLLKAPSEGSIQLLGRDLVEGDTFTQQDLLNAHLSYKVRIRRTVDTEDQLKFQVFVENQHSPIYTYPIQILADPDVPVLTNEKLTILEGGENIISKEHLWVEHRNKTDFVFRVEQDPKHGRLIRESPPGQPRFEGAIKVFSSEDILLERLIYKHDGSESSEDEFTFLAFEQPKDSTPAQALWQESMNGVFRISIQSHNDHVPLRLVDKTFNIVRNGQRLLTTDDILFRDDDSDFNDTQLVYMRMGILSGNIVSAEDTSQSLYRFTQADLKDKKVLFVHHGADRDRFQLQVSDGLHKTTALLEVQASDPYLRIVQNSIVVIDHGGSKTLDTTVLNAETNMDIKDFSEIRYEVTSPPRDGMIYLSGQEVTSFSQEDIKKKVLSYQHTGKSLRPKDQFSFTVRCKQLSEEGIFRIKIFKQGYLSQPDVVTNEKIYSFEGEQTEINRYHLEVEQPDILPSEMLFTIKEPPRLGHVVMLINDSESMAPPSLNYIHSFSQDDVSSGRVLYVSMPVPGNDVFTVDVSNGFTTVELKIAIEIVPRMIPVQVRNFTLGEGGFAVLSQDILNISHPFYSTANLDFIVEDPPKHGAIKYWEGIEDGLQTFTWLEVMQGQIHYLHDSSETESDSFTLYVSAFEIQRRSLSVTVSITILPVNDEPPVVAVNAGLKLRLDETAEITASLLHTKDLDTPADELVYAIETPANGHVALKSLPGNRIRGFTQGQINNGEVIFVHKGPLFGGFSFTVTDGEHTSPKHFFSVTATQLTITVEMEEELLVYPGTSQAITSQTLQAVTSEGSDEITYTVIRAPSLGRLISANQRSPSEEVSHFTQSELQAGLISYHHEMPSESFWVAEDSIDLMLTSPPATELELTLYITISFQVQSQNGSSQLWKNTGLDILQGETTTIDHSRLDASNLLGSLPVSQRQSYDVVFEVKKFPAHGSLTLGDVPLPHGSPYFLQEDVDNGDLKYLHDDSESLSDSFSFQVRLSQGRSLVVLPVTGSSFILEETFNISLKLRDYKPPELVSTSHVLEVLQGSTLVLSKVHLNTMDEDNMPNDITFTVTKIPSNGLIVNTNTKHQISTFTQEDINTGRVAFVSDGTLSEGLIEFTLSDGKHHTPSYTINIDVLSRSLNMVRAEEIQVMQGNEAILITENILKATTGGTKEEEVIYKISEAPMHAAIMVDHKPASQFTQKQIGEGRVSLLFVSFTSPMDSLGFVAQTKAANASGMLNVTVKPLVVLPEDPLLPRAATVLIDTRILDASELANKTNSVPLFRITQQPQTARFVRLGGGTEAQPLETFTQRDLEEKRVALEVINQTEAGNQVQTDTFQFLLQANGVPPAQGSLSFRTAPYNSSVIYGAALLKVPPILPEVPQDSNILETDDSHFTTPKWQSVDRPNGVNPTTPLVHTGSRKKHSRNAFENNIWAIIIPICVIIVLLILAAVLAYYLVRRNKTGKHDVQMISSKPKNGELNQETFRKTDPAHSIPLSSMGPDSKDGFQGTKGTEPDPELLQYCRTTNPALKKNQYWV
ncbi:CSPG4 protein, partial [Amia calva]|nr:CSPG4 protein [Amia calva]